MGDTQLLAEGDDEVFLAQIALFDQEISEGFSGRTLQQHAFTELFLRHELLFEQDAIQSLFDHFWSQIFTLVYIGISMFVFLEILEIHHSRGRATMSE